MEQQLDELRSDMAVMQAKQDRALRSMKDEVLGVGLELHLGEQSVMLFRGGTLLQTKLVQRNTERVASGPPC